METDTTRKGRMGKTYPMLLASFHIALLLRQLKRGEHAAIQLRLLIQNPSDGRLGGISALRRLRQRGGGGAVMMRRRALATVLVVVAAATADGVPAIFYGGGDGWVSRR